MWCSSRVSDRREVENNFAASKFQDEPSAAAAAPAETKLLTPEELKSKEEALLRAGFKPGTMVYEKGVGAKEGVLRN